MSDVPPPPAPPAPGPVPPRRPVRLFTPLKVVAVLLLLAVGGVAFAYFYPDRFAGLWSPRPSDALHHLRGAVHLSDHLDARFRDADQDLVADAPADPKDWIDPPTLRFATLDRDHARAQAIWKEFAEHLAHKTGKKVEIVEPPESGYQAVQWLQGQPEEERRIHLAGLSTGTVPLAVNTAGFVPCCVMADPSGHFGYEMEILVPADSPVKALADLKGRKLTITTWSSLSSAKAPVVLLKRECNLLPYRDYELVHAASQGAALQGACEKRYEAVAVASDLKARELADRKLDPAALRPIYRAGPYPPACFGYVSNLNPKTAEAVRDAFLTFKWEGTELARAYAEANQTQFVAVSYKKDWEKVRELDAALGELLKQ